MLSWTVRWAVVTFAAALGDRVVTSSALAVTPVPSWGSSPVVGCSSTRATCVLKSSSVVSLAAAVETTVPVSGTEAFMDPVHSRADIPHSRARYVLMLSCIVVVVVSLASESHKTSAHFNFFGEHPRSTDTLTETLNDQVLLLRRVSSFSHCYQSRKCSVLYTVVLRSHMCISDHTSK